MLFAQNLLQEIVSNISTKLSEFKTLETDQYPDIVVEDHLVEYIQALQLLNTDCCL